MKQRLLYSKKIRLFFQEIVFDINHYQILVTNGKLLCSSHFIESLGGLATIRAFGWQQDVLILANQLLDDSQRPFYLLQCIQRWLTLVLDLFAMGFALILVGLILKFRHNTNSGFTGIALLNLMTLSAIFMGVVTVWTQLETSIGSVSRVKLFEQETPDENLPGEDFVPPKDWPAKGEIEYRGVIASYRQVVPPCLEFVGMCLN